MFGLIYAFVFTEYKDMRIVSLFLFLILLSSCLLPAQSENNAVYTLPETPAVSEDVPQKTKTSDGFILAGTKKVYTKSIKINFCRSFGLREAFLRLFVQKRYLITEERLYNGIFLRLKELCILRIYRILNTETRACRFLR